ncbi:UNVERIFIED_CONTAM: Retrovirus-related Pol polyprotein from transposon RE2 [Sesamum radiatum]|uniref:Retrovirus-related Pol polyprotein from transposon RE2 n=1 Tax=Sesamum radiatum TaxID=300843 RepID=A0AAW2M1F5_SESRA
MSTNDPIEFEEAVKSEKWRRVMDVEMEAIQKNKTWELTELPKGANKPRGYIQRGKEAKVYKLKKAVYGLKQAPRAWYSRIDAYFMKERFEKCDYEHTLFIKRQDEKMVIISLYVDDLIVSGNDELIITESRNSMKNEFEMTYLGRMRYFLGLEVLQKSDGIFINQCKYASYVLKHFGMGKSNSVHNPIVRGFKLTKDEGGVKVNKTYYKQAIGSLMYLTTARPDMTFAVSLASRYMENPIALHLQLAKRVLRYLKGTIAFGIFYKKGRIEELVAYTDSDYAGDVEDRKNTSSYVFFKFSFHGLQENNQ